MKIVLYKVFSINHLRKYLNTQFIENFRGNVRENFDFGNMGKQPFLSVSMHPLAAFLNAGTNLLVFTCSFCTIIPGDNLF